MTDQNTVVLVGTVKNFEGLFSKANKEYWKIDLEIAISTKYPAKVVPFVYFPHNSDEAPNVGDSIAVVGSLRSRGS